MSIYDCFIYNNEELMLDLRLNYLSKYVKKFVIVEAKFTHQGNEKKDFLDLNKFKKYKNKILHLFIEKFPEKFSNWERENYQRNYISNGLNTLLDDDLVMISDIDEIPNLQKINKLINNRYTVFKQKNFSYKLNLINSTYPIWHGTRMCKKKLLRSPQWLRNQKIKKNFIYRLFNINWNIIHNGGWHFSYLMDPMSIRNKIMSFGHSEYNKKEFINLNKIEEKIKNKQDLFGRQQFFKKIEVDNSFPLTIFEDQPKYRDWII
jgi:beta-1,4-mannosyl-glycoprotein beta-1,4-N-acetylglucosaminyltransferase